MMCGGLVKKKLWHLEEVQVVQRPALHPSESGSDDSGMPAVPASAIRFPWSPTMGSL